MKNKAIKKSGVRAPSRVLSAILLIPFAGLTLLSLMENLKNERFVIDGMFVFSIAAVLFFGTVAIWGKLPFGE